MTSQPTMTPGPVGGPGRLRRRLGLLSAAVLMLGLFTPTPAAQAAHGELLVRDASVVEGDASSVAVRIVLDRRLNHRVSVSYRTVEKTARSGVDFVAVSGSVKFPAGTKVRTVRVPVVDDALDEAHERFRLRIYDAVGASIIDRSGRVMIFDDDPAPAMSVGDVSVTEPTSGSSTLSFPVTLSARSGRTVSVSYVVTAGTASSGIDYVASPSTGQLVLPAGTTTGIVSVSVLSDNVAESSETLQVTLHSPVNAVLVDSSAVGTILDTTAPRLSVAVVTVIEGDPARFVVSLNKPAPQTVTFRYSTSNGTATSPSDYSGVSNASGTIAAGASSTTLTVNTTENTTAESTETFTLSLSNVVNAVVTDGQAQATLLDDDGLPTLSINDASATEGGNVTFTVSLSKTSTSAVTFTYATVDGTAAAGSDYTSTSSNRTIPAGSTTTTITVPTLEDALDEDNETFRVLLSNVANATLTDGDGLGTITDDDATPTLSINDPAPVVEGTSVVFTVTLSAVSGRSVTVNWATSNGDGGGGLDDAVAPGDYTSASGTLTIPAGSPTGTITVATINDGDTENAEAFTVTLASPTSATVTGADATGVGTISASDPAP